MAAEQPDQPTVAQTRHDLEQLAIAHNQVAFLEAFAATGNISAAAKLSGVGRRTHYDWLHRDEAYAKAFTEAIEEAADSLETEARRRALEGVEEPVFGSLGRNKGGGQIGTIRKFSDTLLIFLMKGARPEKYKERHEHSGPKGGPIPVQHSTIDVLKHATEDELLALKAMHDRAMNPPKDDE